jgi:hypothetical protein
LEITTGPTSPAPEQEGAIYARYILNSLDRLVACLDGMTADQFNRHPPAPGANSVYALVVHTLGNAEENILYTLSGIPSTLDREQEFAAHAQSTAALRLHWEDLREQLHTAMGSLSSVDLVRAVRHPRRGVLSAREVLLVVARHAAEHLGQAELTRDIAHGIVTVWCAER